jgi:hypothetical protein
MARATSRRVSRELTVAARTSRRRPKKMGCKELTLEVASALVFWLRFAMKVDKQPLLTTDE